MGLVGLIPGYDKEGHKIEGWTKEDDSPQAEEPVVPPEGFDKTLSSEDIMGLATTGAVSQYIAGLKACVNLRPLSADEFWGLQKWKKKKVATDKNNLELWEDEYYGRYVCGAIANEDGSRAYPDDQWMKLRHKLGVAASDEIFCYAKQLTETGTLEDAEKN